MFNPVSTYRIQFHKDFTFNDLEKIIPYLSDLGIKTLYASPIFKAVPGSTHGYDGVNPLMINPEIGTLDQLKNISRQLKQQGISWLQDIVPNHMAFHQDNKWLMDLLEKGPLSAYREYFDQSLADDLYQGPIMVPFLGEDLDAVIESGQLKVEWYQDKLVFKYSEQVWPLNLRSYATILQADATEATDAVKQVLQQINEVFEINEDKAFSLAMDEVQLQLTSLVKNKSFNTYLQAGINSLNNNKQQLQTLAEQQYYRLCNWQETDRHINFRRFFTVNGLICLNIQKQEVFDHVHELIATLVKEGIVQGLRIDHIDGLYDPAQYLQRLRELAGPDTYIVVEKILEPGEELPADWPIQGTTGYDYLATVNNLFTNQNSEQPFTDFYKKLTGSSKSAIDQIDTKKELILSEHMNGELENLTRLFVNSDLVGQDGLEGISRDEIKQAIAQMLIEFPVYRFYGNAFPLDEKESKDLEAILIKIRQDHPELIAATTLLEKIFLDKSNDKAHNQQALRFYQRCMQFTGPLMAKGVEDTLMYTYNRFIDHNEVGDSPDAFGLSIKGFHKTMEKRLQQWPLAQNATATHDTKRGEGVRARLNVLTSLPQEWLSTVSEWQQLNQDLKTNGAPDNNDEYFIYQTLIGAYPMPGQEEEDFEARLIEYLEKMLREAKSHSNWASPNEDYENGVKQFATGLLDQSRPFWKSFTAFHKKVSELGVINSLSQTLLKLTCPGVPDIYQGCELWDFSLVDPDNRRPVDYEFRQRLLDTVEENNIESLWENRFTGQIKLWLINKVLALRTRYSDLFSEGSYMPLQVKGEYKNQVIAFARKLKDNWVVITLPVDITTVAAEQDITNIDWADTRIILPEKVPANWENCLTGNSGTHQHTIELNEHFAGLPLAVLQFKQPESKRSAGVLMHITSLPSRYGIGDFGPQAKEFADLLHSSGQKYWQILPLNATGEADAYSPYSSYSSQAGNIMLISPDELVKDGLLNKDDLKQAVVTESGEVDFKAVEQTRHDLFNIAWNNFQLGADGQLQKEFEDFCRKEAAWIDDYAIYVLLKQHNNGEPWCNWPNIFQNRDSAALNDFSEKNVTALNKIKWQQYLFAKQLLALKAYCNKLNIRLFGDLPFYISYDSVDVWTNPEIFSLDENFDLKYVAGVPPDYFNEQGQRWGMPVFNWDKLKETNYDWWLKRISKNLEWYDLLRLDHFRAFSSYWEIPANEETAINGRWVPGPGSDFFTALKAEFGKLPFVAEDLGDINEAVYQLRDEFNLPGMKVLQFAFGDDMPASAYIPHHHADNYFVYTGTHDNNTTLGWYRKDADDTIKKNLKKYTGTKITEQNINKVFTKMALASVCKTAIIPVQDLLGLDETSRMNLPAAATGNWTWRLTKKQLKEFPRKKLLKWTLMFNR